MEVPMLAVSLEPGTTLQSQFDAVLKSVVLALLNQLHVAASARGAGSIPNSPATSARLNTIIKPLFFMGSSLNADAARWGAVAVYSVTGMGWSVAGVGWRALTRRRLPDPGWVR